MSIATATPLLLNLGCGPDLLPRPWLNVDHRPPDFDPRAFDFARADVREPLPWPNACARLIAHSHLIEHLTLDEAAGFLVECRRVLEPGGTMRVAAPDLEAILAAYRAGIMAIFDADQPPIYRALASQGLKLGYFLASAGASTRDYYAGHKMFYDEEGLREILARAGFGSVSRQPFGQSSKPELRNIDRHESHSMYVEAR